MCEQMYVCLNWLDVVETKQEYNKQKSSNKWKKMIIKIEIIQIAFICSALLSDIYVYNI